MSQERRPSREERVSGLIRVGELELTGENQAEVDAYFAPEFAFHGPDGAELDYDGLKGYFASLRAAFELLIYHFMFGPSYEAGCTVCSSIADTLDPNVVHLEARDVTLICSSRAPLDKLLDYRKRMGWSFDWVSTVDSDFHRDLGFVHTEEELKPFLEGEIPPTVEQMAKAAGTHVAGYVAEGPGLSAYALSDGTVYRTYVTTARGLEPAMGYYGLLDRTPMGRHEEGQSEFWLRRHDEYKAA